MTARIAVIGAGSWATRHHLPAFARDARVELATVVDADAERARSVGAAFGARNTATSFEEALAHERLDGAVVATPHGTHMPIAAALLRAGVPVLVEKPLALTSSEAIKLVQLVESTGVPLAVGYTAQYTPAAAAVREWVAERIGALLQVTVEFSSRAGALYTAADPDDPHSAYSAANGGGQATTQLSHAFGAITSTTGLEFHEVAALTHSRGTRVDVDDAVAFRLNGGVTGAASSTGTIAADLPMRHAVRYLGECGIVEHDLLFSRARLDAPGGRMETVRPGHLEASYPADAPVQAFFDLLLDGGPNPALVRPAAAAVTAIEAVLRSAESRSIVDVVPLPR